MILKSISIEAVCRIVANHFNLTQEELLTRSRKRFMVDKRYIFFYSIKKINGGKTSLESIGQYCIKFNIKPYDHATVLHGVNQATNLYQSDVSFRNECNAVMAKLQAYRIRTHDFEKYKTKLVGKIKSAQDMKEILDVIEQI